MIHSTAIIAPGAELDPSVSIGPYAVIGGHVKIGAGTTIGPHAVIEGYTEIGCDNQISRRTRPPASSACWKASTT